MTPDEARFNRAMNQLAMLVLIVAVGFGMYGWRGAVLVGAGFFSGVLAESAQ